MTTGAHGFARLRFEKRRNSWGDEFAGMTVADAGTSEEVPLASPICDPSPAGELDHAARLGPRRRFGPGDDGDAGDQLRQLSRQSLSDGRTHRRDAGDVPDRRGARADRALVRSPPPEGRGGSAAVLVPDGAGRSVRAQTAL